MAGIPSAVDVGSAVSFAVRGIGVALGHHAPNVGFRYRAAQRIGVLVADRLRAAAPGHRTSCHQRVAQVQVGQVLVAPRFGGVHHLAGHLVQAVAGIEYERLAVLVGDVAADVVAQREAGAGLGHRFLLEQPVLV